MRAHIGPNGIGKRNVAPHFWWLPHHWLFFCCSRGSRLIWWRCILGEAKHSERPMLERLPERSSSCCPGLRSGGVTQGAVTTLATNAATAAAEQNKVGGQTLTAADITVPAPDFSRSREPTDNRASIERTADVFHEHLRRKYGDYRNHRHS